LTISIWRIATDIPEYAAGDITGEGARRSGGRWNRVGTPMVYAANSIALACLETLVHLNASDLPLNRYLVEIEMPEEMWAAASQLDPRRRVGWDSIPAGKASLDAGETWSTSRSSALLIVPSVIVPEESNILISPLHADVARIRARSYPSRDCYGAEDLFCLSLLWTASSSMAGASAELGSLRSRLNDAISDGFNILRIVVFM
jgi:RES domain-containing protein